MEDPKDIVWNTITESAKTRFDYKEYEAGFSEFGSDNVAENVLFRTIIGYAQGCSSKDIAADINTRFLMTGFSSADGEMQRFVAGKEAMLKHEIRAAKAALSLFEMGLEPPGILVQVRSILKSA